MGHGQWQPAGRATHSAFLSAVAGSPLTSTVASESAAINAPPNSLCTQLIAGSPCIGVESHLIFNPWQQERQPLSRDFRTAGICRRPRIAHSRQSLKPPTRGGFRVSASRYPNVAECGAASLSQEVSPMSRSDFDVVTGPSMAQRRAPVPEQPDNSSDPASGTGAEPAAQPEPAGEKSLAR
jgi:hypothetical protein